VKVVQELLRHANITTTMNLYAQAFSERARQAQSNVIEMVKSRRSSDPTAREDGGYVCCALMCMKAGR
jgi:hypothetical protein